MPSIESITTEEVAKAVEQTQTCLNITVGKLVPLTEHFYTATLKVLRECFVDDEPLCKGLGIQWTDEFVNLFIAAFKENLSFVLINDDEEVMAVRIIRSLKRETNEGNVDVAKFEEGPLKELLRIFQTGWEKVRFFENYDVEEAFQFFGLGVAKKYRQRGIATLVMQAALKYTECLGYGSVYIRGGGSSNYSKRIYEKLGFEQLAEIEYDTYTVDGKYLLNGKTGDHKSMKEYVLTRN